MAAIVDPIEAKLNVSLTLRLRFDSRAEYRLSRIGRTLDLDEWKTEAKKFAFLCDWLWALARECPFKTPEDLALAVGDATHVGGLIEALFNAIDAGTQDDGEKKSTSPGGPSTASPSG